MAGIGPGAALEVVPTVPAGWTLLAEIEAPAPVGCGGFRTVLCDGAGCVSNFRLGLLVTGTGCVGDW